MFYCGFTWFLLKEFLRKTKKKINNIAKCHSVYTVILLFQVDLVLHLSNEITNGAMDEVVFGCFYQKGDSSKVFWAVNVDIKINFKEALLTVYELLFLSNHICYKEKITPSSHYVKFCLFLNCVEFETCPSSLGNSRMEKCNVICFGWFFAECLYKTK